MQTKSTQNKNEKTIAERLMAIKELERIQTPWEVRRVFGEVQLYGSQISIYSNGDNDFVDLEEFVEALEWLLQQTKSMKKEKK